MLSSLHARSRVWLRPRPHMYCTFPSPAAVMRNARSRFDVRRVEVTREMDLVIVLLSPASRWTSEARPSEVRRREHSEFEKHEKPPLSTRNRVHRPSSGGSS